MLPAQFEQIVVINGNPEERFSRTEIIISDVRKEPPTTKELIFGWWRPIYNRTIANCAYGDPIGCIDQVLLNRLEANVDFLARLCEEYFIGVGAITIQDFAWKRNMYVYYADLERIRNNITALRATGYVESDTPTAPLISANGFPTFEEINNWEKCLFDIRALIAGAQNNLRRPLGTFSLSTNFGYQVIRR